MNEDDLRDCFAMFAMCGIVMRAHDYDLELVAKNSYKLADVMLIARKPKEKENEESNDGGIVSVAPKRTYRRKG